MGMEVSSAAWVQSTAVRAGTPVKYQGRIVGTVTETQVEEGLVQFDMEITDPEAEQALQGAPVVAVSTTVQVEVLGKATES